MKKILVFIMLIVCPLTFAGCKNKYEIDKQVNYVSVSQTEGEEYFAKCLDKLEKIEYPYRTINIKATQKEDADAGVFKNYSCDYKAKIVIDSMYINNLKIKGELSFEEYINYYRGTESTRNVELLHFFKDNVIYKKEEVKSRNKDENSNHITSNLYKVKIADDKKAVNNFLKHKALSNYDGYTVWDFLKLNFEYMSFDRKINSNIHTLDYGFDKNGNFIWEDRYLEDDSYHNHRLVFENHRLIAYAYNDKSTSIRQDHDTDELYKAYLENSIFATISYDKPNISFPSTNGYFEEQLKMEQLYKIIAFFNVL